MGASEEVFYYIFLMSITTRRSRTDSSTSKSRSLLICSFPCHNYKSLNKISMAWHMEDAVSWHSGEPTAVSGGVPGSCWPIYIPCHPWPPAHSPHDWILFIVYGDVPVITFSQLEKGMVSPGLSVNSPALSARVIVWFSLCCYPDNVYEKKEKSNLL